MTALRVRSAEAGLADDEALRSAIEAAEAEGAEWLSLLRAGERPTQGALDLARPAFGLCDAVFGAVETAAGLWRPSRLAFDEAARLPHALLHWWVGEPRFIRANALRRLLDATPGEGYVARLFRLWADGRCIKLAAPLVFADREPAGLAETGRAEVLERLEREPVLLPVHYGDRTFQLPYTGRNAGIERDQTRGAFFEAAELEYLKVRVGEGAVVVDVGANTGNHTVFFAGPMRARTVLPFEPMPEAAETLRRAVAANALSNVDLTMLGRGVGAKAGRMGSLASERGGLGATQLVPDAGGETEVVRLDDVLHLSPTFMKIDVEGMELDVLRGAAATIAKAKPIIFVEIANRNTARFLAWLELAKYRIERIFSDKGHANYLIAPLGS